MKIVFTGGGTAGHAVVNNILIPYFEKRDCEIIYIGSKEGFERKLFSGVDSVRYYAVNTGKLRRYISKENIIDVFRLFKGTLEAIKVLHKEKPQRVYSSGGYVSVPAVWAASILRIPVIVRETDYSVGLANKLCMPFADKIYTTFPDTVKNIKRENAVYTGMIINPELFIDEKEEDFYGFNNKKPTILVLGGSSGAKGINDIIWDNMEILCKRYNIIHQCGAGKTNKNIRNSDSYIQVEYIEDMAKHYKNSDIILTRSGSNATIEGLLLGKRMICIPLSTKSSRGEQYLNAKFAEKNGNATIIDEDKFDIHEFIKKVDNIIREDINDSYMISKEDLEERIEEHILDVYNIMIINLEKYMRKCIKLGKNIDKEEFTKDEIELFEELMLESGFYDIKK